MKFDNTAMSFIEQYSEELQLQEDTAPTTYTIINPLMLKNTLANEFKKLIPTIPLDNSKDPKSQIIHMKGLNGTNMVTTSRARTLQAIFYTIPLGKIDLNVVYKQLQTVGPPIPHNAAEIAKFIANPTPSGLGLVGKVVKPISTVAPSVTGVIPPVTGPILPKDTKAPSGRSKYQDIINWLDKTQPTIR